MLPGAIATPIASVLRLILPVRKRIATVAELQTTTMTPLTEDLDIEKAGSARHVHTLVTMPDELVKFPRSESCSGFVDLEGMYMDCRTPGSSTSTTASTPGSFVALEVAPSPLARSSSADSSVSSLCPHVVLTVCMTPVATTPAVQATVQRHAFDDFWMLPERPSHGVRPGSVAAEPDHCLASPFMLV